MLLILPRAVLDGRILSQGRPASSLRARRLTAINWENAKPTDADRPKIGRPSKIAAKFEIRRSRNRQRLKLDAGRRQASWACRDCARNGRFGPDSARSGRPRGARARAAWPRWRTFADHEPVIRLPGKSGRNCRDRCYVCDPFNQLIAPARSPLAKTRNSGWAKCIAICGGIFKSELSVRTATREMRLW